MNNILIFIENKFNLKTISYKFVYIIIVLFIYQVNKSKLFIYLEKKMKYLRYLY